MGIVRPAQALILKGLCFCIHFLVIDAFCVAGQNRALQPFFTPRVTEFLAQFATDDEFSLSGIDPFTEGYARPQAASAEGLVRHVSV